MSDTASKPEPCFVDANIWLYAFVESQDKQKSAMAKAVIQRNEIVVSTQVINEVSVNLIKKAQFDEGGVRKLIESFFGKYRAAEIGREVLPGSVDI